MIPGECFQEFRVLCCVNELNLNKIVLKNFFLNDLSFLVRLIIRVLQVYEHLRVVFLINYYCNSIEISRGIFDKQNNLV